ncbi:MAG: FTR1 family protein [Rhodomicrobium sp.]
MLGATIIVFREVIEAGLIVGIVLAATQGVQGRTAYVTGGAVAGALLAMLFAAFAGSISDALEGMGQEVFTATILGIAVLMLAWHNVWMARHGRELAAELKAAGRAVATGSKTLLALAAVVGIAVLREGAEVVLFLYGIVIANGVSGLDLLAGGLLGLVAGASVSAMTYAGLIVIPTRYLFSVTSFLIAFLAAGMASQCVHFLDQAGILNVLSTPLWDSSSILPADSLVGRVLHTLAGYDDKPTGMQAIVYLLTLCAIFVAMRIFAPANAGPKAPVRAVARSHVAAE